MFGTDEGGMQGDCQARGESHICISNEDEADIKYSDSMLYNQLLYYSSLFDVERALTKARGTARYGELPT